MEARSVLLLVSVLCVTSVGGLLKQCDYQQQCVEFSSCSEFKNYVGTPAVNWPRSVQEQVKVRLCNVAQRGGSKVYSICCGGVRTFPTQSSDSNKLSGKALLDMKSCGKQSSDRIAYGETAKVFEYPWMALLRNLDGQFLCGGTLIALKYVLTAAHCERSTIVSVRLGENDISKNIDCNSFGDDDEDCADAPQDIDVERFIKHPQYSAGKRKNDIGLIKLAQPARLSDSVKTICLPIDEMLRSPLPAEMIVSGWGFTEEDVQSNVLKYAKIPLVSATQCQSTVKALSDAISLDDSQFCAGGQQKKDNCAGDSGGPLQYYSRLSSTVQYGIVSFGLKSCGKQSLPGVYTKVSYYIDWILQNLQ